MLVRRNSIQFLRETVDIGIIVFSLIASCFTCSNRITFSVNELFVIFWLIVSWFFTARYLNLYDEFRSRDSSYEIIIYLQALPLQTLTLISIVFLFKYDVPRVLVLYYFLSMLVLGTISKFIIRRVLNKVRSRGRNISRLLIIGAGEVGIKFYNSVRKNPHFGYDVIGFLDDKRPSAMNGEYIGPISELNKLLSEIQVDNVIVALPNYAFSKLEGIVRTCEKYTTRVKIIPDYFRFSSNKLNVSMFGPFPILSVREDRINEFHWRLVKRGFDFIFSTAVILLLLSWFIPLLGIIIKFSSRGPILFRQERWGRNNKKFLAYKFRSMVTESRDVDENGNYIQASKDDPRITRIGKFIRKTNIDELPQFINVFKGEMSVVGPRPHPTPLNISSKDKVDRYMLRHLVKPGITGWAQVNGYRGETKDTKLMQKRVEHDIWYLENWSFWLDVQIIIQTVWNILKGEKNAY